MNILVCYYIIFYSRVKDFKSSLLDFGLVGRQCEGPAKAV